MVLYPITILSKVLSWNGADVIQCIINGDFEGYEDFKQKVKLPWE